MSVDWNLPVPAQASLPEDLEDNSTRWQGCSVLLSWPNGIPSGETCPFELQAREEVEDHPVFSFRPIGWNRVRLLGTDYVAVMDADFEIGRFRWVDAATGLPGPVSDLCVTHLPSLPPPTSEVFCTRSAVRIRIRSVLPRQHSQQYSQHQQQQQSMTFRIRHRIPASFGVPAAPWCVLGSQLLNREGGSGVSIDTSLGEEDGLVLGEPHILCVQLASGCGRRSAWSAESRPLFFDAPLSCGAPEAAAELSVKAATLTTVTFKWPVLVPPEILSPVTFSPAGRPALECRIDVYRCLPDGSLEHRTSALTEASEKEGIERLTEAKVFNLAPSTRYRAELAVRFARLGSRRWQPSGLTTDFVTPSVADAAVAAAEAAETLSLGQRSVVRPASGHSPRGT